MHACVKLKVCAHFLYALTIFLRSSIFFPSSLHWKMIMHRLGQKKAATKKLSYMILKNLSSILKQFLNGIEWIWKHFGLNDTLFIVRSLGERQKACFFENWSSSVIIAEIHTVSLIEKLHSQGTKHNAWSVSYQIKLRILNIFDHSNHCSVYFCVTYSDSQKHESSCLLSDRFWCIDINRLNRASI